MGMRYSSDKAEIIKKVQQTPNKVIQQLMTDYKQRDQTNMDSTQCLLSQCSERTSSCMETCAIGRTTSQR